MPKPEYTASTSGSSMAALGVIFIVLKLTGTVDWSWWMVTLPFWFGLALVLVLGAIMLFLTLIGQTIGSLYRLTSNIRKHGG
jgi:uncharacterized protein (DUF983 family)